MSSQKLALLIASPSHGLRGPMNDVETIAKVLSRQNFKITRCCGANATRGGILAAWRHLIDESTAGDVVVVYYSGHGGLVETPKQDSNDHWRAQFILPVDYDETTEDDFRGILAVELTHLLRDTTEKTDNVTVILDCCHAGQMARHPGHGDRAFPKRIFELQHHDIRQHVNRLRQSGQLRGETHLWGNPKAVRVMAAAAAETAWEYENADGQWTGAMTDALSRALDEASDHEVSWRTTLLRVHELVNNQFPQQHPVTEGPEARLLFSTRETTPGALVLKMEDGDPIIQGGRVAGVREGNVYSIMPFGHEILDDRSSIGKATVSHLNGFKARTELILEPSSSVPDEGALAFIIKEALSKWPVTFPSNIQGLDEAIKNSKYLRCCDAGEVCTPLVEIQQHADILALRTRYGIQIASQQIPHQVSSLQPFGGVVMVAEQLARAQHLLALRCENTEEKLSHSVEMTLGLVDRGNPGRTLHQDGKDSVGEQDRLYIGLTNEGIYTVYVSVFDVNVAGKVCLVSNSSPKGIELPPGRSSTLGRDQFGARLKGLELTWPDGVPKWQPVDEQLVLVLTDSPVDLRQLASPANRPRGNQGSLSSLEELACCISYGGSRDIRDSCTGIPIRYNVDHVPFSLCPKIVEPPETSVDTPEWTSQEDESKQDFSIGEWPSEEPVSAAQILGPETVPNWKTFPSYPPTIKPAPKGVIGAMFRATRGIPPCVWVVNQHSEEITVVVSKYRPNRVLSGAGLSASPTGGGLDFSTTTFISPATKKTLAPQARDPERSIGVFPLWTRKEGFGVISIFTGPDRILFIENDRIPIGSTAYFTNQPNLRILGYDGKEG